MVLLFCLTLLSFWTRFRQIDRSNIVVWDEAHFGKFGAHYLEHEYYTDVHPPLGKLLVAASGWLANFDGGFKFDSGKEYPEGMDYRTMRIFNATWGALVVPLAYLTARQAHMSRLGCILAAMMVLFDTAYLTISRFILLDSMLLFFTALTCFALFGFHNQQSRPFSFYWWTWLSLTGVTLGCVLSVKWVGLFAVSLVGIYTIEDLWDKLAENDFSKKVYAFHWIGRAICLLFLPALIYLACFKIHFEVLYKTGTGDTDMTPLFQAHLEGNNLGDSALDIAFGSNITIRTVALDQTLLHSHPHNYAEGSKQAQITGYYYQDENSNWRVKVPQNNKTLDSGTDINIDSLNSKDYDQQGNRYINNGDTIRLNHMNTHVNLHSHQFASPISEDKHRYLEVSGYGNEEISDAKDNWIIEVVRHLDSYSGPRIHSLATQFRLRHAQNGCILALTGRRLPDWGFYQMEIGCAKNEKDINDDKSLWVIETNQHDNIPNAPKNTYKYNFLRDFWYLNVLMWKSNNAMVSDPDQDDILASTPTQWPLVGAGLRMCRWTDDMIKFYLLGNPMVWWPSIASVGIFSLLEFYYTVRGRRQIQDKSQAQWNKRRYVGKNLFFGWFLHYIPFYIMGRVMYLHHYFPALYFSILLVPFLFDHFTTHSTPRWRHFVFGIFMTMVFTNFTYFSPFAYGMDGPIEAYSGRHWLKWWNLTGSY
ncbi:Dolichyl-phosphate-mannose-protein mannosyltransferase-domain-containing protein [Absidia repens]|uniref:Dolichyl-phosphate-mannose--protein mannosyltransferase n=1 Tax=Absidia repens TaxID=90262 RepID=A0A1X2IXV0_9FUNG|nr:Dolichyl-phosphate-mannose-protein mannosyltransferase-domain-containing protein [Absidia repens]